MAEDGKRSMRKLVTGDVAVIGRCPSQGPDNTIAVTVRQAPESVNSARTPLELRNLTKVDFDGDEVWIRVPMALSGINELIERWNVLWIVNPPRLVFRNADDCRDQERAQPHDKPGGSDHHDVQGEELVQEREIWALAKDNFQPLKCANNNDSV